MHKAVLAEILQECVVSSRGRWNRRCVKRSMSSYSTKGPTQYPSGTNGPGTIMILK